MHVLYKLYYIIATCEFLPEYTKEVVGSTILTHIEIKLQDTPGELLKVLKLFKVIIIAIIIK